MKETEIRIAALFGGKVPQIEWDARREAWTIALAPSSPADHYLVLTTARGGVREFQTIAAAVKLCQRLGLDCMVRARPATGGG